MAIPTDPLELDILNWVHRQIIYIPTKQALKTGCKYKTKGAVFKKK
jgi:hypothetical protein